MRWRAWSCWMLAGLVIAGIGLAVASEPSPLTYEVGQIKKKLFREEPTPETLLEEGARLDPGTLLRTGSGAWAEIDCPEAGTRFRLASKTRARLASGTPGLLLEVEKGRVRALFDKLTGGGAAERLVTTPTAVLAVRGTEYGVEVDSKGRTTVTVFSGEVQVRDREAAYDPVIVAKGQYVRVRHGKPIQPAKPHDMKSGDWDRGRRPDAGSPAGVRGQPGRGEGPSDQSGYGTGSGGGSSSGSGSGGSHGGGGRG